MLVDINSHRKIHWPQSTRQPAQLTRPFQEPDKWMECRKKLEWRAPDDPRNGETFQPTPWGKLHRQTAGESVVVFSEVRTEEKK